MKLWNRWTPTPLRLCHSNKTSTISVKTGRQIGKRVKVSDSRDSEDCKSDESHLHHSNRQSG